MRILSLKYNDQSRHWQLNPMTFNRLTLLVGASGAGKTQILNSVLNLKKITRGDSVNGLKWEIKFSTVNTDLCIWEGEFENRSFYDDNMLHDTISGEDEKKKKDVPGIVYEKLYLNDSLIVDRDQDKIIFNGKRTVRLPRENSAIYLLKEEEQIAEVYYSFQKIILHDPSARVRFPFEDMVINPDEYQSIEDIQESNKSLRTKLYLASLKARSVFDRIKYQFTDVFPYVEDLNIIQATTGATIPLIPFLNINIPLTIPKNAPLIHIKEKGVDNWIDEAHISSGMQRVLLHISELYLCANGTVILADEFENSLGINCIDEVTNELLAHKRDLQFIITSHHPYIINNISHSNWKLITRKAGVITARDPGEFSLSKSKHEAFTQLINLDEYSEGIEI